MNYAKGQILTYHFPERAVKKLKKTSVIAEYLRIVILHKRQTPYKTVLIAPLTTASAIKTKGLIPSNYVQLMKNDYPGLLDHDSYINLDMIMVTDYDELEKIARYGKPLTAVLNDTDLIQLDYKLTLTYELSNYFNLQLQDELRKEMGTIVEYIDIDIRARLKEIISNISDKKVIGDIVEVIDMLVSSIKKSHIKKV